MQCVRRRVVPTHFFSAQYNKQIHESIINIMRTEQNSMWRGFSWKQVMSCVQQGTQNRFLEIFMWPKFFSSILYAYWVQYCKYIIKLDYSKMICFMSLQLEMCRKEIMHRQPGETVFHPGHFGCLFSFPETLTLTSCGFVPGSSFLDKQLATLPPGEQTFI